MLIDFKDFITILLKWSVIIWFYQITSIGIYLEYIK